MRMNSGKTIACVLVVLLAVGLVGVYLYASRESLGLAAQAGQMYSFVKPAFCETLATETTFLEEEAGISLYANIGRSIDLAVAGTVFRTIEKETSNYAIGSIPLPGLTENDDVHCFVHIEGWIVVYYLEGELVIKIADWNNLFEDLTKNKLETGLELMTNALGEYITGPKYYHFQYPNANKFMVIVETLESAGQDGFDITIPLGLTVYERSWSHCVEGHSYNQGYSELWIDENMMSHIKSNSLPQQTEYGELTITQLSPNLSHVVSVTATQLGNYGVGIGLVYQEP